MVSKNFIIDLMIYPFDVMVSIGESDDILFKKLIKLGISQSEIEGAKYDSECGVARYCLFVGGQSLIRIKQQPKTDTQFGSLHHEIFHCVVSVMWKIGVKLKIGTSDEAYTYLCAYLTREIYKKL